MWFLRSKILLQFLSEKILTAFSEIHVGLEEYFEAFPKLHKVV